MLAALINVPRGIGYPVLFGFVAAESAGALVPGETSLIVAAALASQGQLSLPLVIAVAAGGAILGDNVGYLIGRKGLRRLIERPGRWAAGRRRLVERGERFFDRHGSAAVFFGRWLPGMRVVTSWFALAPLPPLERPRRDRLGDHGRVTRLRTRARRIWLTGCDRLSRARRRRSRMAHHPRPAPPACARCETGPQALAAARVSPRCSCSGSSREPRPRAEQIGSYRPASIGRFGSRGATDGRWRCRRRLAKGESSAVATT
jgi:membrane protein YqaA with SNARE-associated domain